MTRTIEPMEGVVLVRLPTSEFGDIPVPTKSHDSLTYGEVISVAGKEWEHLIGRIAYWRKYKDDARVGDNLCLIEVKDILGSSYASTASNN